MSHLLCLGLGYCARVLAASLLAQDWTVEATTRSGTNTALDAVTVHRYDGAAASQTVRGAIHRATHLLVSAPPDAIGDPLLRHHACDIVEAPHLQWIGYLSTVGVYGDCEGRWVDETTPAAPHSTRSRWRLEAEDAWRALAQESGRRTEVFRLAGIYGPGRSAIDALRAGTARRIVKPGQVFNRIHVADIAKTLQVAIAHPTGHTVFNVTDDEPAPPQDVVAYAAQLLGMPIPAAIPFDEAGLSPMGRSFYGECKRVSNERIRTALGVELAYPTYREGLAQIRDTGC